MRRPTAAAALTVLLTACSGGDAGGTPAGAGTRTTQQAGGDAVATLDAGVTVEGSPGAEPAVAVPGGEPPTELVVSDLVVGEGAPVEPGASVTTHYVGVAWSDGEPFDSSWTGGRPISFPLDNVIAGWQQGIPGMRPGGRRLLVVPPDLAYGDQPPAGAGFGPGETLVFVIDLVETG